MRKIRYFTGANGGSKARIGQILKHPTFAAKTHVPRRFRDYELVHWILFTMERMEVMEILYLLSNAKGVELLYPVSNPKGFSRSIL